ncbi:YceI family protein [Hyalangium minutum]|uniref:Protein yceI n=1 Tax=Hyalangium minutum TaxID=394096 RepID=A0A085W5K2_9BACT|nr:YceI family protein [Hyalangium minutum]KFE62965.1 Protein yceI precursor [Hyalangium minutum]
MKNLIQSVVAAAAFVVPSLALAANWEIDPGHSSANFTVKHMMVTNVKGEFSKVTGTVTFDEKDPSKSSVNASIDASTIDTRNEPRDNHLKSPDFFDVAKFPAITFKSKKVEKAGEGKYKVTGDLTMHGITKETVLDVDASFKESKNPFSGASISGLTATTKVNRKDFGLNWNKSLETGGVLVGDDVNIGIELELVKKDAAPAVAPVAKPTK